MNFSNYINDLQSKGYLCFTRKDAKTHLKISQAALSQAIWRFKKQKKIIEPARGFCVIVPIEYRQFSSIPPEYFISDLMKFLNLSYYVCLLSAAELYGAAHQKPQVFQVMTNQKRRSIIFGKRKIEFIYRNDIEKISLRKYKTPQGYYNVSTPEATAIDLITYLNRSAGLNYVYTVLIELAESIQPKELLNLVKDVGDISKAQRLGYLFELAGFEKLSDVLAKQLQRLSVIKNKKLSPRLSSDNAPLNKKWHLFINTELESDI